MTDTLFEPHDSARLPHALASLPPGARVRLGAGRFVLAEPIVMANGIELTGEPGKTILDGQQAHGIIVVNGGDSYDVRGITFEHGVANWGGAISCGVRAKLTFDQCRFVDNRGSEDGGAVFLRSAVQTKIVRCTFESNAARRGGGALDVGNGADVLVDRCVFSGNEAKVGGAVFLSGTGALELRNCTLLNNRVEVAPGGAGLFVRGNRSDGPSAYVANCVFAGPDVIAGEPTTKYTVYFTHSIVPAGLFGQQGFQDAGANTSGAPELVQVAPGLWGLAPGSKGTRTAKTERIDAEATDMLGQSLVRDGIADPGALAYSD